jgi:hypothetical protein
MAAGQHNPSRRALLGAVVALPLLSRHPELGSGSSSPPLERTASGTLKQVQGDEGGKSCAVTIWDQALARFQEAQAVLDGARSEPDEDAYDRLLDSHSDALNALLALPAPNLPALAAKLDVIVPQQAWELTGSEDCLEILRQDAHRLVASSG